MPKALLVYPEQPRSFWSFEETLKLIDKKSAFPPLGLLTIAGMMPRDYDLRIVDMNVAPLTDHDLAWADIVITSSMIIHWDSLEVVIARCNARGLSVLCGGPLPTQYCDELRGEAVFYRGEAENGFLDVLERMLAERAGLYARLVPDGLIQLARHADATALRQRTDPSRDVDPVTEDLVSAEDGLAEMDPDVEF